MKRIAVLCVCMLLAAWLTGCNVQEPATTTDSAPTQQPTDTQPQANTTVPTVTTVTTAPTEPTVENGVTVRTKYGFLFYQDQWEECMVVTQTDDGDCITVVFEAQINEIRYPLFRVVIGTSEGDPVGQLTDAQGKQHDVFVYPDEIGEYAELTDGEQNRLYAMQEEINFLIENLK